MSHLAHEDSTSMVRRNLVLPVSLHQSSGIDLVPIDMYLLCKSDLHDACFLCGDMPDRRKDGPRSVGRVLSPCVTGTVGNGSCIFMWQYSSTDCCLSNDLLR